MRPKTKYFKGYEGRIFLAPLIRFDRSLFFVTLFPKFVAVAAPALFIFALQLAKLEEILSSKGGANIEPTPKWWIWAAAGVSVALLGLAFLWARWCYREGNRAPLPSEIDIKTLSVRDQEAADRIFDSRSGMVQTAATVSAILNDQIRVVVRFQGKAFSGAQAAEFLCEYRCLIGGEKELLPLLKTARAAVEAENRV